MPFEENDTAISVLVPIYNVEKYLEECLDSLLAQTFTDFEVLLINDGSTDGSRDIIQRYMDKDARFKVIDKENSGYGSSMNQGIEAARGAYVAILESDDFFEPDALQKLYFAITEARADVAKANFWFYWSTPEERNEPSDIVFKEMDGRVCCPSKDEEKIIFYQKPSIWSGMYRRAFLNDKNIRFLETPGASYQDASFNFKLFALAERAVYLHDYILHYRQDNEASSINNPGKVYCVCDEYAEMNRFLLEHPELDAELRGVNERMKFDSYMWNATRLSPELRNEFLEHARKELLADREAGLIDESVMGIYKRTDLHYLLDNPDAFVAAIDSYGGGSLVKNLRHYTELDGPALVAHMVTTRLLPRRS